MNARVLMVGASGQVGRQLRPLLLREGWEVPAPGHDEVDVTDEATLSALLADVAPRFVINAAALSDVDGCTRTPSLAWDVNAFAPILLGEACRSVGAKLVHLSTDYVFDGRKGRPYVEEDLTHPIQVYGRTKRAAEEGILDNLPSALVVRTAWVFGGGGRSDLMERMLGWAQSAQESPTREIQAATDQRASPTYAADLAWAIVQLMGNDVEGLVHVTNQGGASRADFATLLYGASHKRVGVRGVSAASFPTLADRPRDTVLSVDRLMSFGVPMRPWQDALLEAVAERTP